MGRGPDTHGFEWMANAFWESLAEMGREGLLSQKELLHMTAPSAGRSVEQIEEPFKNGLFAGLSLDNVSVVQAPDPYWEAYSQNGDAQPVGRSWAAMMSAATGSNFAPGPAPALHSTPL